MRTFILMSRLCPHGPSMIEAVSRLHSGERAERAWVDQVKKICPEAKFIAHYALLGAYDFMDIYEAPDENTAAKVAMIGNSSGAFQVETWTAIPDTRLLELAREVRSSGERERP